MTQICFLCGGIGLYESLNGKDETCPACNGQATIPEEVEDEDATIEALYSRIASE